MFSFHHLLLIYVVLELEFFHIIAGAVVLALPAITLAVSHQVRKRSCKRRSSSKSSMLFNSKGKKCEMIAHKGAALDGPENTIGAIHKVKNNQMEKHLIPRILFTFQIP